MIILARFIMLDRDRKVFGERGFTLIELIVVIAIIGILGTVILLAINPAKILEDSKASAAKAGLNQIAKAAQMYTLNTGELPPDVARGVPTVFQPYLGEVWWAEGPWKNSQYDWDNWLGTTCWDGSPGGVQVTLRDISSYKGHSNYTLYLPIQGDGIPHCTDSTAKGECINCPSKYP